MRLFLLGLMLALVAAMPLSAQDVCSALKGATVVADDGTYLGKIDSPYASESILNEYGTYGSKYSTKSIWNEYGKYGGEYSKQSPFNKYSSTPPAVVKGGKVIAYLTVNSGIRGAINPYVVKSCEF